LKQYYGYDKFVRNVRETIQEVKSFEAEAIVAVARGGLMLSHALAEGLNIREVQSIRTELYDGSQKREELTLFSACNLKGKKRVLVVDDISDSGVTFSRVMTHLEEKFPDIEFYSVTLFYKKTSEYEPNYWIHEAHNWIEFFWEKDFS